MGTRFWPQMKQERHSRSLTRTLNLDPRLRYIEHPLSLPLRPQTDGICSLFHTDLFPSILRTGSQIRLMRAMPTTGSLHHHHTLNIGKINSWRRQQLDRNDARETWLRIGEGQIKHPINIYGKSQQAAALQPNEPVVPSTSHDVQLVAAPLPKPARLSSHLLALPTFRVSLMFRRLCSRHPTGLVQRIILGAVQLSLSTQT